MVPLDTQPAAPQAPPAAGRIGLVSAAASVASGVVTLNIIIANVAFTAISADFGTSLATTQWVATGYVLGLMTAVPLTGWATARFGVKRLLLVALGVFLLACALCGLAWSEGSLIAFRVLAGCAGGVVPPLAHAVVVRAAGGLRLATAMSVLNGPVLAVPVLAPALGGLLVGALGWRWVFLCSVPLAAAALVLVAKGLPRDEPEEPVALDLRGFALLSSGLVLLVYGLAELGRGSSLPAAGITTTGLLLTALFAAHALDRRDRALLDVRLFRRRTFALPSAITAVFSFVLFGSAAILPLYFEVARSESTVAAGLLVGVQGVGSAVGLFASGYLADRYGAGLVAPAAVAVALLGTLPWLWLSPTTGYAVLLSALFVRGLGLSALMNSAYAVAYGSRERAVLPGVTAALNIVSRVTAAAGVAVTVILLNSRAPGVAGAGGSIAPDVLAAAFSEAFALLAVLTVVALVPTLLLPRMRQSQRLAPDLL